MQKTVTKPHILVTGATGQQGGAIAKILLKQKIPFRAMSRTSHRLEPLEHEGYEKAVGTFRDKAFLKHSLEGIKQTFLVTTPFEEGMVAEVEQGINFIDAAKEVGIEHLVYTSVASCDQKTGIPHFETKWQIEQYLKKSGLPATILRPVFFMENFGSLWFLPDIERGQLSLPIHIQRKIQMISAEDVGKFAFKAFSQPHLLIGKTLELAAEELTLPEAVNKISQVSGKPLAYKEMSLEKSEKQLGHDFTLMYSWLNEVGFCVDCDQLEQKWHIPLTDFDTYLMYAQWISDL